MEHTDKEIELLRLAAYYEGYAAGVRDSLIGRDTKPAPTAPPIVIPPHTGTGKPPWSDQVVVSMYGCPVAQHQPGSVSWDRPQEGDDWFADSSKPHDLH